MDTKSMDIYIRSLVVEAMGLGASEVRIRKTQTKPKIDMKVEGEYIEYPHPPRPEFGNLVDRLKTVAGFGSGSNGGGKTATFTIQRRGVDMTLSATLTPGQDGETIQLAVPKE